MTSRTEETHFLLGGERKPGEEGAGTWAVKNMPSNDQNEPLTANHLDLLSFVSNDTTYQPPDPTHGQTSSPTSRSFFTLMSDLKDLEVVYQHQWLEVAVHIYNLKMGLGYTKISFKLQSLNAVSCSVFLPKGLTVITWYVWYLITHKPCVNSFSNKYASSVTC